MNKRFTKKQILEASITMDTDTFNKMKGTLDAKDRVKVVPKGSLEPERGGISEDHLQNKQLVYGRDLKIGNILTGTTPWKEIIDLDSSVGAWLIVTVRDTKTKKIEKYKFYYQKKYYVLPLNKESKLGENIHNTPTMDGILGGRNFSAETEEDKKAAFEIADLIKNGVPEEEAIEQISDKYQLRTDYLFRKYKQYVLNNVQEDLEKDSRAVEYGYDPELDGDKWEDFLNSVAGENNQ